MEKKAKHRLYNRNVRWDLQKLSKLPIYQKMRSWVIFGHFGILGEIAEEQKIVMARFAVVRGLCITRLHSFHHHD